ncbi:MAG: hypothetical protein V4438_00590 [Patescibacteria group bacterium]
MAYATGADLNKLKIRQALILALMSFGVLAYVMVGARIIFSRISSLDSGSTPKASAAAVLPVDLPLVDVGQRTGDLVASLRYGGLNAVPISAISRDFFSVIGRVIVVNGDNFMAFEYSNPADAEKEAGTFRESAGTREGAWKRKSHLYLKDNLVVLYLGVRKDIQIGLDTALGAEIALPQK